MSTEFRLDGQCVHCLAAEHQHHCCEVRWWHIARDHPLTHFRWSSQKDPQKQKVAEYDPCGGNQRQFYVVPKQTTGEEKYIYGREAWLRLTSSMSGRSKTSEFPHHSCLA